MQIGKQIHQLRIPFQLEIAPWKMLDRFVNIWLVFGNKICLIDSGTANSKEVIFEYVRESGRDPNNISLLVLTHGHPDHIGAAISIKIATGCIVAAHEGDKRWIEDTELQYRERPVPDFHKIVEGPVKVDQLLCDGDKIRVGDGGSLRVIHAPGHSPGQVALWYETEKTLFSADCIPVAGDLPIYDDAAALVKSIRAIQSIQGVELLLSSWAAPIRGNAIAAVLEQALNHVQTIHIAVRETKVSLNNQDVPSLVKTVSAKLGLPAAASNPLFYRTVQAHLRAADTANLLL